MSTMPTPVNVTTTDETAAAAAEREARTWDDATWILTSAFIIFTMQSGFGLLESGFVNPKNEVNIMAKNVADVVFGGISYWMLGYGLSFGDGAGTNGFCGVGKFFIDPDDKDMGEEFSKFVFQTSFATTATTIVSGAIAERTRYLAYIIFSFFNTFIFCFPAHWVWSKHGWLKKMGVVDVAGDGPVHLVGGVTSLVAAVMIKPRHRRFTSEDDHRMGSPTGALLGLFTLWWGWLAFNCGSTYGISSGKWKMAARAAATTLMSASTGGLVAFLASYIINKRKFYIPFIINGVLAGLVAITASCAVTGIWESLIIGAVGSFVALASEAGFVKLKVDDPVGAISVHGVSGAWGLLAAGIFTHKDTVTELFAPRGGLTRGGGFYLLGIQVLSILSIGVWTAITSYMVLKIIDLTLGLRMSPEEEELGADYVEHNIKHAIIEEHEPDNEEGENEHRHYTSSNILNGTVFERVDEHHHHHHHTAHTELPVHESDRSDNGHCRTNHSGGLVLRVHPLTQSNSRLDITSEPRFRRHAIARIASTFTNFRRKRKYPPKKSKSMDENGTYRSKGPHASENSLMVSSSSVSVINDEFRNDVGRNSLG